MHLHTLTLQALGPFPGRHTIDFAELGASGIFLLEGPTGAGKSTIIDAVVFALYGKVASKDASEDRLRSAHAAPDDETFVDLVLETGTGIYRVRRTPAYQRPKQRGRGTTTQQASVRLWRLTSPDDADGGELLSTRLDEAGAELTRAVGLDRAQFVQTVVLPQGEFASFLRADPESRRGLLQKVFGTEVYEQVQKRLEVLRAEANRAVDAARAEVDRALARFAGAAGTDDGGAGAPADGPLGGVAPEDERDPVGQARERHGRLVAAAERTRLLAEAATVRCAELRGALDAARATAEAIARREALRAELAALLEATEQHAEGVRRRDAALRARAVMPLLDGAARADEAVVAALRTVELARGAASDALVAMVDETADPDVRLKTLLSERDRCTGVRGGLTRLLELEAGLDARREALAEDTRLHAAALEARRTLAGQHATRPAARAALETERRLAASVADARQGHVAALDAAEARLAALADVHQLDVEVAAVRERLVAAATAARAAVDEVARLQAARIAGIAGELAAGLVPGEPCSVCGATDHPAPAAASPDHVSPQDVAAADGRRAELETALAGVRSTLDTLTERRAQRAEAVGDLGESALVAARDTARAAVQAADAAARRLGEVDASLATHDAETAAEAVQLLTLEERAAALGADVARRREQVAADELDVLAGCDGAVSVRERAATLDARVREADAWASALRALVEAQDQAETRREECAAALAEHDFADPAGARAAALADRELAALDTVLTRYTADLTRVRAALAEPALAVLAEDARVDVEAPAAAHAQAEEEARTVAAVAAGLAQRAAAAGEALTALEAAGAALDAAVAHAAPVVRMANVAAASGGEGSLTLATYVLGRRFEDVVAAANARLVTMSDGRYELERSTEREDVRSRRTGLAMRVLDHRTESARDPRTLSGGETFYVSLCLALGLADVVTAEAGGIDLGTLFVDEGFGSLDPDTLEGVLTELGRLRDGGRVVGVVSHVDALKQSIAERIEVRRRPDGTSTLTVRA